MSLDPVKNLSKVTISTGYDESATSIVLETGDGDKLPDPSTDGEYNIVWWNFTDYPDPSDDPYVEIVRVNAKTDDTLSITRAQEDTIASVKNISNKVYKAVLSMTKKMIDDIETDIGTKEPLLPSTPSDPTTKFLDGNKEWREVVVGSSGYAANVYLTNISSTIDGSYKQLSYTNDASTTTESVTVNNTETLIRTYLYEQEIGVTTIDAGEWSINFYTKVSGTAGSSTLKFEVFKRTSGGTETTLFSVYTDTISNTDYAYVRKNSIQGQYTVNTTDRLGVRVYGKNTVAASITIYYQLGDDTASWFNTPLALRHSQLRGRDIANSHPASAIQMDTLLDSPTYSNQNDFNNSFGSTGRKTGGEITDAGSSYVAVTSGTGFIKATDDDNAQLIPFDWDAPDNILIPTNTTRYIGVEYNGGSPRVVARTSYNWDFDTDFPLGRVINQTINGVEELYIGSSPWWVTDGITNIIQAIRSFGLVRRDIYEGGLIVSVTGTRNLAVTAGKVWIGLNDLTVSAIDTSVSGTFESYWYSSTNGWQSSNLSQYSVTQWNDVTQASLQTIATGKYCNVWIYGELSDSTPSIAIIYPQAEYNTPAQAEATSAPSNLPEHIKELGILLGRVIIKQGTDTPVKVQSAFGTTFTASVVTDHGNLAGLSDDDHTQYFLADGSRDLDGDLNITDDADRIIKINQATSGNGKNLNIQAGDAYGTGDTVGGNLNIKAGSGGDGENADNGEIVFFNNISFNGSDSALFYFFRGVSPTDTSGYNMQILGGEPDEASELDLNGGNIGIAGGPAINSGTEGILHLGYDIGNSTKRGKIKLFDEYYMPDSDGTNRDTIITDGSGNLMFTGSGGWYLMTETCTYYSSITFTLSGDYTGLIKQSDYIRLVQSSTTKYFYVVSVVYSSGSTYVTVNGGGTYTLANATISDVYYSKIRNPIGYPEKMKYDKTQIYTASESGNDYTSSSSYTDVMEISVTLVQTSDMTIMFTGSSQNNTTSFQTRQCRIYNSTSSSSYLDVYTSYPASIQYFKHNINITTHQRGFTAGTYTIKVQQLSSNSVDGGFIGGRQITCIVIPSIA